MASVVTAFPAFDSVAPPAPSSSSPAAASSWDCVIAPADVSWMSPVVVRPTVPTVPMSNPVPSLNRTFPVVLPASVAISLPASVSVTSPAPRSSSPAPVTVSPATCVTAAPALSVRIPAPTLTASSITSVAPTCRVALFPAVTTPAVPRIVPTARSSTSRTDSTPFRFAAIVSTSLPALSSVTAPEPRSRNPPLEIAPVSVIAA